MQSQGVLGIERMCQATGVSRAGFYRGWEQKAPDEAAMALRDAIQRASVEYPSYGAAKVAQVVRKGGLVGGEFRVCSGQPAPTAGSVRQFRECKIVSSIDVFSGSRPPGMWTRWN
jgi:hypothetical protein